MKILTLYATIPNKKLIHFFDKKTYKSTTEE